MELLQAMQNDQSIRNGMTVENEFRFDWKLLYQSGVPENAGHARVSIHDAQAGQERKKL